MEADHICQKNGGYLVEIDTMEEKEALEDYLAERGNEVDESWLYSLFSFKEIKKRLWGQNDERKSPGWWIGATDKEQEGEWIWEKSGNPVTLDLWHKWVPGHEEHQEPNNKGFGGEQCANIMERKAFASVINVDDGPNFGWVDFSCYRKKVRHFGNTIHPLCEK